MKNSQIKNIIRNAIDLHVHVGPELIPRKYTTKTLIQKEENNIAGLALKNHFFPTIPFVAEQPKSNLKLIGSVVLNNFLGGLNPDAIYAASTIANKPFIVWFPTVSAKKFLSESEWEVAPEWVGRNKVFSRKAQEIESITILTNDGKLTEKTKSVLKVIQKVNATLATGHVSWQESRVLVKEAAKLGIKKIIITHPIYQKIMMPLAIQKELVSYGAKIEHCFSMYSIDKIPVEKIAEQIKRIGPENCILSSDVGQTFSPSPSEALEQFALLLIEENISMNDLKTMLIKNPTNLVI